MTRPYAIFYTDNTYLTFALTEEDYTKLCWAMTEGKPAVVTSVGILGLKDVRNVVMQLGDGVQQVPENENANPVVDKETEQWLEIQDYGRDME